MSEVEETVDDINICLYQLRLKQLSISIYQFRKVDSKTLAKVVIHEDVGVFCEM
jgi:hypothetical protein